MLRRCKDHPYTPGRTCCAQRAKLYRVYLAQARHTGQPVARRATPEEVEQARRHVTYLVEVTRASYSAIARRAGCHRNSLTSLMHGHHRPRVELVQWILGVQPDSLALRDTDRISITPTRRRLQAAMCDGWSVNLLAQMSGLSEPSIRGWRRGTGTIEYQHARAVQRLTDSVRNEMPPTRTPVEYTMGVARRMGYLPWDAWPGNTIDDPLAQPVDWDIDKELIERVKRGEDKWASLNAHERYRLYSWYRAQGLGPDQLPSRHRITRAALHQMEQRYQQKQETR